jgi:hypothetical protein
VGILRSEQLQRIHAVPSSGKDVLPKRYVWRQFELVDVEKKGVYGMQG